MKHIVSCSFGKDSLAMLLMMLEKQIPIDEVVYFNTGAEFESIQNNVDKMRKILKDKEIIFTELKPRTSFMFNMLKKKIIKRNGVEQRGYGWCGGACRWGTSLKTQAIKQNNKKYEKEEITQYIGIAYDEPKRVRDIKNIKYPLVDWKMTEKDCLKYCYSKGWNWKQDGIDLYQILDRVSCWCCKNKNLNELRNIYKYLPKVWQRLKELQSKINMPYRKDKTIFDLEDKFRNECKLRKLF